MICTNHSGLPMAALHGHSPPPYTFVTGDLIFLPKILSKSVVYGPNPFKDALKRPITTILPSITTTHHDCGLPSPLSCALFNDNPPIPSTPTQRSRQNLRNGIYFETMAGQNGRQCSLRTNWKQNKQWQRLTGSAGGN